MRRLPAMLVIVFVSRAIQIDRLLGRLLNRLFFMLMLTIYYVGRYEMVNDPRQNLYTCYATEETSNEYPSSSFWTVTTVV